VLDDDGHVQGTARRCADAAAVAARVPDARLSGIGLGGIAAGNLVLALTAGRIAGVVIGVVIAGVGLGIASVAATSLGTQVDEQLSASAAGLLNTAAQLGTALGVAALVTLASVANPPTGTAIAWTVSAALATLASLTMLIPRTRSSSLEMLNNWQESYPVDQSTGAADR
jgi:MFS family permease